MDVDVAATSGTGTAWRRFALHFGEMVLVMFIGMAVLGAAARGLYLVVSGSSFVVQDHVVVAALVMAFDMTLPMVLWMRFRGHSWERGGEMGLAMFVPTLVALGLYWAGVIGADAVLGVGMILMLPAMLLVMLVRKEEYSASHASHAHRRRWLFLARQALVMLGVAVGHELWQALSFAFGMTWEILWALILGFALSGVVQAFVSQGEMRRLMPDDSAHTLLVTSGLGAASSSCSYASVALARSLFRKGANFTAAMAFQFASTNLVIELGIIMWLLLGWEFVLGEFVGGPLMIVFLALVFRRFLSRRLVEQARSEAEKGRLGQMEGHAEMDMSVTADGTSVWQRLRSPAGFTATANYFVMDWAAVARDIFGGLLIAGALAAWVPDSFWQGFFLADHATLAKFWGPLIAPAVAIVSFVCSIGNVPLAAVLWNGGISFGGVLAFIFADLIILPILDIYRRYYGWKMAAFLLVTFYATMAAAGLAVEFLFQALGLTPTTRDAKVVMASVTWNYTTYLNIIFLLFAATLVWRYFRYGGGLSMLRMMDKPMTHDHQHAQAHAHPQ